jgi:hypothetical protein
VNKDDKREEFVSTRSRIDKLGVKGGTEVLVLGVEADCQFMDELRERGAIVRTGGNKAMDMIFALFRHRNDLDACLRWSRGSRPTGCSGPSGQRGRTI